MDFLNDVEKAAVQQFYEFETMREAVKKVLLAGLYSNGTLAAGKPGDSLMNAAITFVHQHPEATNEQIGTHLRALYAGLIALEQGFNKLAEYKKVEEKQPKPNKAR